MNLLMLATLLWIQDSEASEILDRYESLRPTERELALFRLDWAATLHEAKERAVREGRPVFLISVENEHGGLYGGHC